MKHYFLIAQRWWLDRTDQEQRLLAILAPVLIGGAFYWFAWQPLADRKVNAERAIVSEQKALREIKVNAALFAGRQPVGSGEGGSLSQVVSGSASSAGLNIARIQPQGDKLQIWLTDTQFEKLLGWLAELSAKHGVQVDNLDIAQTDQAGLIQVRRLVLVRL